MGKLYANATKIYKAIAVLLTITVPLQASADTIAIIGGQAQIIFSGYAALISSPDVVAPLTFSGGMATSGLIQSVSISATGNSLIGGQDGSGPAYAALVSSSGTITTLTFTGGVATTGDINSVAINAYGNGIIGGRDTSGPIYAALVPPSGNPLIPLTFSNPISSGGIINAVAINDSGNGLIGGQGFYDALPAYAAFVSPSGTLSPLTLIGGGIATTGNITTVSINSSGNGIIGGMDQTGSQPAYAALVSSSGVVTPLTLTGGAATKGNITSVSINSSGNGIIGGQDLTINAAYAAIVAPSGAVLPLDLGSDMAMNGIINSVAINSSGNGIIGGQDLINSAPAYAAFISPSGTVTPLVFGGDMAISGVINSVAIDESGNAIIGGQDQIGSSPAYAALVTPTGTIIPLTFTGDMATTGTITSVSLPGPIPQPPSNAPQPPSNLQGKQKKNDFGLEYELYNQLKWTRSPSPAIVGYFIYRDGTKIGKVNGSTYTYQDHNRKKGVFYIYAITAVNSAGGESSPIAIVIRP